MQSVPIDLKKSEEIADWATDKEPGDRVCLYGTIKSKDNQTMVVTVEEVDDGPDEKDKSDRPEGGNEGSDAAPVGSPPGTLGAMDDEMSV